jgi:hypothetical protein
LEILGGRDRESRKGNRGTIDKSIYIDVIKHVMPNGIIEKINS